MGTPRNKAALARAAAAAALPLLLALAPEAAAEEPAGWQLAWSAALGNNRVAPVLMAHYDALLDPLSGQPGTPADRPEEGGLPAQKGRFDAGWELAAEISLERFSGGLGVGGALALGLSQASARYANGIGIVRLPVTITSRAVSLNPRLYAIAGAPGGGQLRAGVAHLKARTRQELSFGVVVIHDDLKISESYPFAEIAWPLSAGGGPALRAELNTLNGGYGYLGVKFEF